MLNQPHPLHTTSHHFSAMLTFRKSLIAALFMVFCIFYLRSSSHGSSPAVVVTPDVATDNTVHDDHQAIEQQQPARAPGQKKDKVPEESQKLLQQPPPPLPNAPLRERLRYQFSYDVKQKFPAYIWQTWKNTPASMFFPVELRPDEASWTELNPGFVHEVVPDDIQASLVKHLYAAVPEVYEAFDALPLAVLKADFFRYLILLARGGIYSDIDTSALQPAADWLPRDLDQSTVGLVVGIEADPDRPDWHQWYSRRVQFCQWTIQSKPGHPVLRDMVAMIVEETLQMKKANHISAGTMEKTVVEFTGPAAWTDAVFRYFNNPEYFNIDPAARNITYTDFSGIVAHKKVGDVVVLPITSFSPGVMQMGAGDIDDPMAFVKHNFGGKFLRVIGGRFTKSTGLGTWKTEPSL